MAESRRSAGNARAAATVQATSENTAQRTLARETSAGAKPYRAGAKAYRGLGLGQAIPVTYGDAKEGPRPVRKGLIGHDAQRDGDIARDREKRFRARFGELNLGLHLSETVVALDVDDPAALRKWLKAKRLTLPATPFSTARGADSERRQLLYRVPPRWTSNGLLPAGGEIVDHAHRYVRAWPSVHKSGGVYGWYSPTVDDAFALGRELNTPPAAGDLAELPSELIAALAAAPSSRSAGKRERDVEGWIKGLKSGKPGVKLGELVAAVPTEGADNNNLLELFGPLVRAAWDARGGRAALEEAVARYSDDYGPDARREVLQAIGKAVGDERAEREERTMAITFPIRDRQSKPKESKVKRASLAEADLVFAGWLGADYDLEAMHTVLATAAVERMSGDPVWLLLVSGSGNAKTETVSSLTRAGATVVSSIASAGALLSGTSGRERSNDATGGLLEQLGSHGILVFKDVTSLLSLDRHARAEVFAALREVYDGHWIRQVGTDGGRELEWSGRLVVIGAVTSAWDRVSADTISQFGDRFAVVRMDSTTGRVAAGRQAIGNTGHESRMRRELAEAAAGVLKGAKRKVADPDADTSARILAAADVVTLARTAVDLDYRGNVVDSHAPEMPTRFAKQLAQLWRGAVAIGLDRRDALAVAIRCARDSMPPLRLEVLEDVAAHPWTPLREVVKRLDKPRATVDRALQALHLLGLLTLEEEVTTGGMSLKESTTWRYTVAPGIDVTAIAKESNE